MKNMTEASGKQQFNFGIRKPVLNCEELLSTDIWSKFLLNKWVYLYEPSEGINVYFKHVFRDSRIYQIVYSGLDILGDGVYLLYKATIEFHQDSFLIIPDEFLLKYGSFEIDDFMQQAVDEGLISQEEKNILTDYRTRHKFVSSLKEMKDRG